MKTSFVSVVALFVAAVSAQLQINTPSNVVQCLPQLITWTGSGSAPYFITVMPGGQPSASALVNFPSQSGSSLTWNVNIAAGTSIMLSIRDQTGNTAMSAPFNVQSSSDSSCVGQSASVTGGSATASSPASTGASSGSSAAGSSTSAGSSSSAKSSSTSSSSAAASSKSSSASTGHVAQVGAAGVVGAVLAAILA
ncbi:hypothetical protein DFH11DRAFT_1585602 [Phellopilus nigrolimitatus]|nr:hypothetical protein DFH11DRAFT_1585602 [Phellopilus nigrolimitatus]